MPPPEPVRVGFVSLGCPKNLVDTEIMLGRLRDSGFALSADVRDCDVIVVNTCGFIDPARRESVNTILEMAEHKKKGRCRRLVVAGCMVQRYPRELREEIPEIDAFVDLDGLEKIVQAVRLDGRSAAADPAVPVSGTAHALYDHRAVRVLATPPHTAYLKISEGCDRPCSFCAIPSIRGRMRSRTAGSLRLEAEDLARRGVKELILIAQDSTDYGRDLGDGTDLAALLRTLEPVPGIEWIRIHYAYPGRVTRELLETMAGSSKACRYLDIPLQHSDGAILKAMKRGGNGAAFLRMIRGIRRHLPGCALRTTFIVGFPGESRQAFGGLCEFVREAQFDHAGVFTYSSEEGTPASALKDDVPAGLKEDRRARLMEIQSRISLAGNRDRLGKVFPVRVDGLEPDTRMLLVGRTEFQSPDVDGRVLITDGTAVPGQLVPVRMEEAHPHDLVGRIDRA